PGRCLLGRRPGIGGPCRTDEIPRPALPAAAQGRAAGRSLVSKRRPREDESALWRTAMQDVRPLKRKGSDRPAPAPEAATPAKSRADAKPKSAARATPRQAPPPVVPSRPHPELEHGKAAGLDRRSSERLRRGRLPIEGRLDLHGMTQAAAAE